MVVDVTLRPTIISHSHLQQSTHTSQFSLFSILPVGIQSCAHYCYTILFILHYLL